MRDEMRVLLLLHLRLPFNSCSCCSSCCCCLAAALRMLLLMLLLVLVILMLLLLLLRLLFLSLIQKCNYTRASSRLCWCLLCCCMTSKVRGVRCVYVWSVYWGVWVMPRKCSCARVRVCPSVCLSVYVGVCVCVLVCLWLWDVFDLLMI